MPQSALRKICNHYLKPRFISELSWNFFEKYKCPDTAFVLQSSRYISNEQSCFKSTGLYDECHFTLFDIVCAFPDRMFACSWATSLHYLSFYII